MNVIVLITVIMISQKEAAQPSPAILLGLILILRGDIYYCWVYFHAQDGILKIFFHDDI